MKNIKTLSLVICLAFYGFSFAQIAPNKTWTDFTTFQGVHIEYKYKECTPDDGRNQILVLFRYTNTTQDKIELTWKTEIWRNNTCTNCNSSSSEHHRFLVLNPNEIVEADGSTKKNKSTYIFGNFLKLVPGMTKQQLTDFKFQNLAKKII